MVACRTLCRHLAKEGLPPGQLLAKLNAALADDNPACMFVTLIYGTYAPATGQLVLTSAGHPPPLLRRAGGEVETVPLAGGRLLGYPEPVGDLPEHRLNLAPGEALIFFTDGLIEARLRRSRHLFGAERVRDLVRSFTADDTLSDWAEETRGAIESFLGSPQLPDDLTLLLLRRRR
jgi:sigma-B regulation protein RsbU (phosphoserine phosphatase)